MSVANVEAGSSAGRVGAANVVVVNEYVYSWTMDTKTNYFYYGELGEDPWSECIERHFLVHKLQLYTT